MAANDCIVVSNRGPLSFRFDAGGDLIAVPGGGGLVSSIAPLLAGTGATWVSVTMGAADRAAVEQGRMVDDSFTLLPVVIDDETYRSAYDVVANTTLWYLPSPPLRPAPPAPVRPALAAGLGGLPPVQPGRWPTP